MSKRFGKARYVLPQVVNPPDSICYKVPVPNDPMHLAAFMGQIYALGRAYSWADDDAHTARLAAGVWFKIFNDLRKCDGAAKVIVAESDYDMSICEQLRFQNGKLQALCCGEWQDIDGQGDNTLGGSGQPGDGSTQPGPGQSECYSGRLLGTGQWYLPTVVSTGDTIEITDPMGAWHDGAFSAWRCPDGNIFFAGGCIASTATDGGDPLPSQPHMSLIAEIGGSYYPILTGGVFTVPGGVSHSPVTFQANDGTLTDNAGEISFKACVTNNQAGTFQHAFNLATNPEGWHLGAPYPTGYGNYLPGTGFVASTWDAGSSIFPRGIAIKIDFSSRSLTKVRVTGALAKGTSIAPSNTCIGIGSAGVRASLLNIIYTAATDGDPESWEWTGLTTAAALELFMEVGVANSDPGGSGKYSSVTIEGIGSDPF
jgi:hypothetical protein